MDQPHLRRAATLAVLSAAVLSLAACGGSDKKSDSGSSAAASAAPAASDGAQATIAVAEDEYSLKPSPARGKAGKVTFAVQNAGAIKHEFVVIKTDKKADALGAGGKFDERGTVEEIGDIEPAKSAKLVVDLEPGHYALICNLPGHYMPAGKPGMLADFTVK